MALPTKAQWADYWNAVSIHVGIGKLVADQFHIFRAFRPVAHDRSTIKVNWSDGATADAVAVTAGTPQGTVAPGQVNDQFTLEFGAIGSQAVDVFQTNMQTVGFEAQMSLELCLAAIYRKWVAGIVGSGAGTAHAMYGFETFLTASTAAHGSARQIKTDTTAANILKNIDYAITKMPPSGYNICLVDAQGYNYVKEKIRGLGGITSSEVLTDNFGASVLSFDDVAFFHTTEMDSGGTSPSIDSEFDFFNIGPQGVSLVVPSQEDPIRIQGPKQTKGEFDEVFDVAMVSQLLYTSPRAGFKLIQRVS